MSCFRRYRTPGTLVLTTFVAGLAGLVTLAVPATAEAYVFESVPPARWQDSDAALGFVNPVVETFEDQLLADGLTYQVATPAAPTASPLHELPSLFAPADDTFGNAFAGGDWDGPHGVLNTADNRSHPYSDASSWGTMTLFFFDGASRVGFSLVNMQKAVTISVNGVALGAAPTAPGTENISLAYGRNGYLIISSGDSGPIYSVTIANTPGDGWLLDHLLFQRPPNAVMAFLPDDMAGKIHRILITRDQASSMGSIAATAPSGVALSSSGELFTTSLQNGMIQRFRSPQSAATPGTTFGDPLLQHAEEARFVDGELWVLDSDLAGSTNPAALVRFKFDAAGTPAMAGSITTGLMAADRAMLWNPLSRELFVSQCCGVSSIVRMRVAPDRATTTPLQAITGNSLANPHGMVISPFGELLVANAGSDRILRFVVDPAGGVRPTGAVIGNGLTFPIGLVLTPWGQLLAVNQGNNTVSRFTLDMNSVISAGTFEVDPGATGPRRIGWLALAPVAAACAPVNSPACQGMMPDAGAGGSGGGGGGGGGGGKGGSAGAAGSSGSGGRGGSAGASGTTDGGATDGAAVQDARADQAVPRSDAGTGTRGGGGCGCGFGGVGGVRETPAFAATALTVLVFAVLHVRRKRRR